MLVFLQSLKSYEVFQLPSKKKEMEFCFLISVKIWHLDLTQPQELAHDRRIAQVHISRPPIHSSTNVIREERLQDVGSCLKSIGWFVMCLGENLTRIFSRDVEPYSSTRIEILSGIPTDWN